jgi:adenosylhomocysteine nucleosidase
VDADGLIAACATASEERAARKAGYRTAVVGIRASRGVPAGELVSFGVAGGVNGAPIGMVIDATRVVDERGAVLWEGAGLGVGRPGTILALDRLAEPDELRRLHEATGADAVDMESGVLAASGRLRGCVRAISDSPQEPLGRLARAVTPDGRAKPLEFLAALALAPKNTVRALVNIRRALRALSGASATGGSGSA